MVCPLNQLPGNPVALILRPVPKASRPKDACLRQLTLHGPDRHLGLMEEPMPLQQIKWDGWAIMVRWDLWDILEAHRCLAQVDFPPWVILLECLVWDTQECPA